jgi:RimJ/RimL family protein N-acetyltransferase
MISLSATPVLETERLILRAPAAADWPHWHAFARSERAKFVGGPMTDGVAWRAFCHIIGMWVARGYGSFVFVEKASKTPLGLAGPWHPWDWQEREIGWTVTAPEAEGKGYAFEAAAAARAYAFRTLGWETAVSYIDPANARSIALARRLGAVFDADAPPSSDPDDTDLVFRHPRPEVVT